MRDIRVLLVEDNCSTCALLRAFFDQAEGLSVCGEAHDGWEGLELLRELRPDLVLLDLIMPGMDGLEFLRTMESETPRPKVIVLSGVVADEYVQRACRLGASYYLVKPVNLIELAGRIDTLFPRVEAEADPGLAAWTLLRLGADRESLGYRYALFALGLLAEPGGTVQMKKLYLDTAEAFGTTYSRVEKNLRTLIKNIHRVGGGFYTRNLGFGGREKPPDNGTFLRAVAEEIREKD